MTHVSVLKTTPPATTLQFTVVEQLYDTTGRPAFTTEQAAKGAGAVSLWSPQFETGFVTPRNPVQSTGVDFWKGGPMSEDSLVDKWVNQTVFSGTNSQYAYKGSYYETDPLSRVDKTSGQGVAFNATSTHTLQYHYGQYNTLPGGSTLTPNINTLLNPLFINQANILSQTQYGTSTKSVPLGTTLGTPLIQLGMSELLPGAGFSLSIQSANAYLMSCRVYTTQNLTGSNNPSGVPVVQQNQSYAPNTFDNSGNHGAVSSAYPGPYNPFTTSPFQMTTAVDALGRVTYRNDPDRGNTLTYYDSGGLLRFTQDADQAGANVNGNQVCLFYVYDDRGRLSQVQAITIPQWNVTILQAYLKNGTTGPAQSLLLRQFTYDAMPGVSLDRTQGRLVQVASWSSPTALYQSTDPNYTNSQVTEVYAYDALGRLQQSQLTYGPASTPNFTVVFGYNNLNQMNSLEVLATTPIQGPVLYTYNAQGQMIGFGASDYALPYATYTYNADGTLNTETLNFPNPAITRTYTYNTIKQLTSISDDTGAFTETLSYLGSDTTYQDGNIQEAQYTFGPYSSAAHTYTYAYDPFSRLTSAQLTPSSNPNMPPWEIASCGSTGNYDANGNIWGWGTTQGGTPATYCNTYNPTSNQLQSREDTNNTYTYTPSGYVSTISNSSGVLFQFTYDTLTKRPLIINNPQTGETTQIFYNAKGERTAKQNETGVIQYCRSGSQVLAELLTFTNGDSYEMNYVYGPVGLAVIGLHVNQDSSYAGRYSVLRDHLGSARMIYDEGDLATSNPPLFFNYSPWGEIVTGNSSPGAGTTGDGTLASLFRYLYTGQEWDPELSLYNYHARQYDPSMGRFLAPDPAYQSPSPYMYVADNPINYTDPDGNTIIFFLERFNDPATWSAYQQFDNNGEIPATPTGPGDFFNGRDRQEIKFAHQGATLEDLLPGERLFLFGHGHLKPGNFKVAGKSYFAFVEYLKNVIKLPKGYKGPLYLGSCYAGVEIEKVSFAQLLADEFGVDVYAPKGILFSGENWALLPIEKQQEYKVLRKRWLFIQKRVSELGTAMGSLVAEDKILQQHLANKGLEPTLRTKYQKDSLITRQEFREAKEARTNLLTERQQVNQGIEALKVNGLSSTEIWTKFSPRSWWKKLF